MEILVVDDEIASRKTLELFSRKMGHDVTAASDGAEAYEIWQRDRPKVVITDWNMPKMNGLELCSRIRAEEGDDYTYLVIVTARDDNQDLVNGLESGADDYIAKPFSRDELQVRIKAAERILNLQSKDIVIFALARLAESRDEDTGQHLERIRHYSKVLSETMFKSDSCPDELDSTFIANIFLTSPLHDIGKVGIPDYILLKPGRLDDKEFNFMKSHTTLGFETLDEALQKAPKARYLKIAADIALCHHEKFDGSGYPKGLAGEDIPLSGRIVALADVYDALTSKRPYKEPFTHDRSKAIILDGKGSHFDPAVVDAFIECEHSFVEIRENFKEE